jgi:hypothetical protein
MHNVEHHNLYASPNITRRMRWAGLPARIGKMRNAYNIWVGKSEGGGLGVGKLWNRFIWLSIGTSGGFLLTR